MVLTKILLQKILSLEKYGKKIISFRGPDNVMMIVNEQRDVEEEEKIEENEDTSDYVDQILNKIKF